MLRLLISIGIVAALWFFLFKFNKSSTSKQKSMMTKFLLYALAILLLLLVATGRAHWLFALIGASIPWLQRLVVIKNLWNSFKPKNQSVPSSGKQSVVQSEYLEMRLDHDSGSMNGTILKGSLKDRQLDQLNLKKILSVMPEFESDPDSLNLLKAYLNFRFQDQWTDQSEQQTPPGHSRRLTMSKTEALAVLGLEEEADKDEIRLAHKKLMQKLHPDRGGSEYLASKINQAKDLLLS